MRQSFDTYLPELQPDESMADPRIPFGVHFMMDAAVETDITDGKPKEIQAGIQTGTGTCFDGKTTDTAIDDDV